jgi:NTE family protein
MPDPSGMLAEALSPVVSDEERPATGKLEDGHGLCMSGGGYRAMLFHVGALWRLNEAGLLRTLARVSCVSGGSITGGVLGLKWGQLDFDGATGVARRFVEEVVEPLRKLAGRTIDVGSVIAGLVLPGTSADRVTDAYRQHLFGDATLQDLPDDPPRIVLNATNVQSGALWRFMKPYMRDYRVGEVKSPRTPLAVAVGASSAFPPVLSPATLALDPSDFTPGTEPLHREPFTTEVVLTDGGVYDNLGLETVWKRYRTVFVSDGGGQLQPEPEPERDPVRHSIRVNSLIDNQVRSLRKRQVVGSFEAKLRTGAYWGIRTDIAEYGAAVALPCPADRTLALANTPTRLARMEPELQQRLINWGYAVSDAALRRYFLPSLPRPTQFPLPGGVG